MRKGEGGWKKKVRGGGGSQPTLSLFNIVWKILFSVIVHLSFI